MTLCCELGDNDNSKSNNSYSHSGNTYDDDDYKQLVDITRNAT